MLIREQGRRVWCV